MRAWAKVLVFAAVLVGANGRSPLLAVPTALPYVGYLTDADGTPLDNLQVDVHVALYDAPSDGQRLWPPVDDWQAFTALEVFDGVVGLVLGDDAQHLDALVLVDAPELWLAVEVRMAGDEAYTSLTPRQQLLAVPYALVADQATRALDAVQLGGQAAGDYVQATDLGSLGDEAGFVRETALCPAATSCAYADLIGAPDISLYTPRAELAPVALTGAYDDLNGMPALAPVATSGEYDDLNGKPDICNTAALCPNLGPRCGGVLCPSLAGYIVGCNMRDHCEYQPTDVSGWRRWDVWIWVPPGQFWMGSPEDEPGREPRESPQHLVTIAQGFFIMKSLVWRFAISPRGTRARRGEPVFCLSHAS